jgi:hypothetical protein
MPRQLDVTKRKMGPYSPFAPCEPEDAQQGQWSVDQLRRMDERFQRAVELAARKDKPEQAKR